MWTGDFGAFVKVVWVLFVRICSNWRKGDVLWSKQAGWRFCAFFASSLEMLIIVVIFDLAQLGNCSSTPIHAHCANARTQARSSDRASCHESVNYPLSSSKPCFVS